MYEPAGRHFPNLAFFWPALVAASTSEMTAWAAKQFANFAVGPVGDEVPSEPKWATPHAIALELKTVRLRDFTTEKNCPAALLCAPLALHGAAVTDLAPGHSLVAALRAAGLRRLFVTDWRSATADMGFRGIDDYLADLNVLVDEIGAPVDLIGLCQGGWMALAYAARFPAKVRKLVLAGAPIDIEAAPSALSGLAEASPLEVFREMVRLGDGCLPGRRMMKFWGPDAVDADSVRQLLQTAEPANSATSARLEELYRGMVFMDDRFAGTLFSRSSEKIVQA
jgi:poly(3-hydroxybutyrate) depolymerase